MDATVLRTIIWGLRVLWAIMMVFLLILILTDSISGYSTVVYSLLVLAVMSAEMILRKREKRA